MSENTRRLKRAVAGVAIAGAAPAFAQSSDLQRAKAIRATRANGITSRAQHHQFNLPKDYTLSRRTGLNALQAFQRANGEALTPAESATQIINATATIGDGFQAASSSSRSMVAVGAGVIHRF
ncbi:hypothetical protein LMG27952_04371 [Paraburkholderia hiiakae]|uniref:Uncharacterized protein n=1 Tax=Paraburkholderia hiiakae TaxID=1081782 RepID=A0ABM8NVV5_9BURK|nr:hypothetical protein LMG27952_04371 [Paraburkholderia hiiakae]